MKIDEISQEARTKYQTMLDENQATLAELSAKIGSRFAEWSHPEAHLKLVWEQEPANAVRVVPPSAGIVAGETGFEGKIARLGHGLQRSLLLALLQELAGLDDHQSPTLILGCEEPELYQHPPQARYLASVFEHLADTTSQILITTHSPYFVSGEHFESIRLVRKSQTEKCACIHHLELSTFATNFAAATGKPPKSIAAAKAKLHQALQPALSEMFFTEKLVLVEGLEDVAYIQTWMTVVGLSERFRRSGAYIVPVQGKSELIRPTVIALGLSIPLLVIADADGDKLTRTNKETQAKEDSPELRANHQRDNVALARLLGGDEADPFPSGIFWGDKLVLWPSDLADQVKREVIISFGPQGEGRFESHEQAARSEAGNAGDLGKNSMYISYLLEKVYQDGGRCPLLDRLCRHIVARESDLSEITTGEVV